jgi:predicted RND superfamily exporter protein
MKNSINEKLIKFKNIIKQHKIISSTMAIILVIICLFVYDKVHTYNQLQKTIAKMETDRKNRELKEEFDKITDDYKKESEAETNQLSDVLNKNRILVYDTKEIEHSNGYYNIQVTVENLSKDDVTYTKIGLSFKNDNGEIIQSDNIIDDNIIKPKAKQTLTKKVSDTIKYKTIESEVLEVK